MTNHDSIRPGDKFDRWTVIEQDGSKVQIGRLWRCRCSCGKIKIVLAGNLRSGRSKSCGCLQRERASKGSYRHGHTRIRKGISQNSPTYSSWQSMKARCLNVKMKCYPRYGGRGIRICDRWLEKFENFLADMGPRPSLKYSIDRFPDKNGNYEPGNCRWATLEQQAQNQITNRLLTFRGKTQCLAAWSREIGIRRVTLAARLRVGKSVEEAFMTPVSFTNGKGRRSPTSSSPVRGIPD